MGLRDRKCDGLVLRCIMGAYCMCSMWPKMTHHYLLWFFSSPAFHSIITTLCWLMTLLVTPVTHVFHGALISHPILWDHIMLHLHLSVLLAQPPFKVSLLCRINDGSLKMFSQLLLFSSLSCALCATANKPPWPLFKHGKKRWMFALPFRALLKSNKAKHGLCQIASTQATPVYCQEIPCRHPMDCLKGLEMKISCIKVKMFDGYLAHSQMWYE